MGDGRVDRAMRQGRARTTEMKSRVPELRERVPELTDELKTRGSELRTRGAELRTQGGEMARQYAKMDVSWARCSYAKAARAGLLTFGLGPMIDFYVRNTSKGSELFERLTHPVIFVANHSSHIDTPTILRALPHKWRARTAVAAAADYFYKSRWKASGVALLFNTVPLGRQGGGLDNGATDHVDKLLDEGWNLVMFPEGTRSRDGGVGKVRSGAAVIAARHGIPIVPIYLSGTHEAMPPGQNWPRRIRGRLFGRRHRVEARFGDPISSRAGETPRELMERVRVFWANEGLAPVPPPASAPPPRFEHAPEPEPELLLESELTGLAPVAPVAESTATTTS